MPMMEQQKARIVRVVPDPGGCMQRRPEAVAGVNCRQEPLLKRKNRDEPQLTNQKVPRGEPVVERSGRRTKSLDNGTDGDSGRPPLAGQRSRGRQEVLTGKLGSSHDRYRFSVLEYIFYIL